MDTKQDYWHPPPQGFLKYNINGASKGNLGTASFGGVLRDEIRNILSIFHGNLGKSTNNMAKSMAMEQFLELLVQDNGQNVIIESDSELIINTVKRISCGFEPEKVSKHQKLIQVFQRIQLHLRGLCTVSFNHVWRKANKLVDLLANQGVKCTINRVAMGWQGLPQNGVKEQCDYQADEDMMVYRNKAMEALSS